MIDISVGVLSFLTTTSPPWSPLRFSSNHCFLSSLFHESPTFRSIFLFSSSRFSSLYNSVSLFYHAHIFLSLPLSLPLSLFLSLSLSLSLSIQLWAPPYVSIAIGKWNPWWSRCHGDSLHSLTSAHLTSPRHRAFISHPACSFDLIKTGAEDSS